MKWKCSRVLLSSSRLASRVGKAGGRADNWQRKGNGSTRANKKPHKNCMNDLSTRWLTSLVLGVRNEKAEGWRRKPSLISMHHACSVPLFELPKSKGIRSSDCVKAKRADKARSAKKSRALSSNAINHWLFILYYSNF